MRAGLGFGVAGSLDLREVCSHAVGELDPYVEVDGAGLEAGHDRDQVAGHVVDLVDGAGLGDAVDLGHLDVPEPPVARHQCGVGAHRRHQPFPSFSWHSR